MHPPISRHDLACILDEADAAARRLHRRLCLPASDLDDLRQDLLIDLICRLPAFDACRGSIGAFAGIVLRNQASRLALKHHRDRRSQGGALVSLNAPRGPGATDTLGETLGQSDGLAAWLGQDCDDLARADLRHDIARVLGHLEPDARLFCAALGQCPLRDLVARGVGSRSALYRRTRELRLELTARGLGPAWDGFRAA
jgi:DNA-directed RNA polymerase specialized sigma24 family protein